MFNIGIISIGALIVIFGIFGSETPKSTPTDYSSEYSQCINDPNTQFQIGVYKQKYPNVSNSSIAHIICK